MDPSSNILLIRLKSIGDVLFTLPAVQVIRENFPGAKITFLVSKEYEALLAGFREVDEIIPLDRARFRSGNPVTFVRETIFLLRRLRRGKFSLAVDFQGFGETALFTWCTRAQSRWGMVYQPTRAWAYTKGLKRNWQIHPAEWNLFLLQQCGLKIRRIRNEFVLPDASFAEARRLFAEFHLDETKPTLFIQPFTSSPQKNWPLDRYIAVAHHWRNRGVQILFGGGPADRIALEPVHAAGFPVSAGAPLLVTGGLMRLSALVLGGDTGLLHMAVALNKRVLMIMKSNVAGTCHPFQHSNWTMVPDSRHELITAIEHSTVLEACTRAFEERNNDT